MNPLKARRVDISIHQSRHIEKWNEVASNGIHSLRHIPELIEELEMAIMHSRTCRILPNLYDVVFHVVKACSRQEGLEDSLKSFFARLNENDYYWPHVPLPPRLQLLAEELFLENNPFYENLCELGFCLNSAGLHYAFLHFEAYNIYDFIFNSIRPVDKTLDLAARTCSFATLKTLVNMLVKPTQIEGCFENPNLSDDNIAYLLKTTKQDILTLKRVDVLLKRKFIRSLKILLKAGIRLQTLPFVAKTFEESKPDTRTTRLFYRHIGYVQGDKTREPYASSLFNITVLNAVISDIDALSNTNMRLASRENRELYFFLLAKRVTNAWGIAGKFTNPANGGPIDELGLEQVINYFFWMQSLRQRMRGTNHPKDVFALKCLEDVAADDWQSVLTRKTFTHNLPKVILTGDSTHAFTWIKYKNFFIYGNRGFEAGKTSDIQDPYGITILKFSAEFTITKELFSWFVYSSGYKEEEAPYINHVKKVMPLEDFFFIPLKMQSGINCVEVAMKLSTLILYMIEGVQDKGAHITKEEWKKSFDESYPLYKQATTYSRLYSLDGLLKELQEWNAPQVDNNFALDILLHIAAKIKNRPDRYGDSFGRVASEINRLV